MSQRATRQLAAVYDVLVASRDHPTAEQVFRRVRDTVPRVSLGTVYRNLDKLREQGRLRVVRLASGEAHYDAMVEAHDHFVCERCHAVLDLDGAPAPPAVGRLRDDGCVVHWHTTALYGLCGECAAEPTGRRPRAGAGQAA
ncbi:MAG TPA: transcriptional repressor [Candidatus Dormibacteraeota bacterium]|nr:transcriptional repressor [Candidatus Dormibacteraeota bacterium]